jgi:selenocysteine-specific translation elongation factor
MNDRAGLALKGIEAEELDRGYVLTNDPAMKVSETITGIPELVKYWTMPVKPGMVVHAGHWMQFLSARIESVEPGPDGQNITIRFDKPVVHPPGSRGVLHYLEGGKLRVMGTIRLP